MILWQYFFNLSAWPTSIVWLLVGGFFLVNLQCCQSMQPTRKHTPQGANLLVHERSPYLLQHAYNPVQWHPWGDAAFEKAQKENKLMIISIGYAACHWCHVMEEESFEDEEVAALMNTHYVSVKVDREERPDVDKVYMDTCLLLSRRGGWPLNAIALPNGKPIFAGTYFDKHRWMRLLNQLHTAYTERPEAIVEQADKITQGIRDMGVQLPALPQEAVGQTESDRQARFDALVENMLARADRVTRWREGCSQIPHALFPTSCAAFEQDEPRHGGVFANYAPQDGNEWAL